MKILFTSPVLEYPPAGGPQLRIANSIKILAAVGDVHVISRQTLSGLGGPPAEQHFRRLVREFSYSPSARPDWRRPSSRLGQMAEKLTRRVHRVDIAHLVAEYDRLRPDVVWFGYGNISHPLIVGLRRLRSEARLVCDTDSVWSRFIERGIPFERRFWARQLLRLRTAQKQREERTWMRMCDVVTAVSKVDADYYRGLGAKPGQVRLFSNLIDPDYYRDEPALPAGLTTPYAFLAGTYGPDSPMEKSTRWLLDTIWPNVRRALPDAKLCIVGRGSKESLGENPGAGIHVAGRVASVLPYLKHAAVALVPLSFESGTRFKILEAGICGKAIVSTVLGAEGIALQHGVSGVVTDDPAEYTEAIVRCLENLRERERLGRGARDLVLRDYSLEAGEREVRAIGAHLRGDAAGGAGIAAT